MRMEANQKLNDLCQNSNSVFYFLRRMKKEGKDVQGERCLKERDGRLFFLKKIGEKFGSNTWKRS